MKRRRVTDLIIFRDAGLFATSGHLWRTNPLWSCHQRSCLPVGTYSNRVGPRRKSAGRSAAWGRSRTNRGGECLQVGHYPHSRITSLVGPKEWCPS